MRFIITLRVNAQKFGRLLPLNYQYEMSAAIYKTLSSCSEDFASWLHDNGFKTDEGKQFKLFTFSRFNIPSFRILRQSNQLELLSDQVFWQISFLPENSTQTFIGGVFENRVFEIGNKDSIVEFETFGTDEDGRQVSDGMDVGVVIYNKETSEAYFAGAGRPVVIIRDGEMQSVKGNQMPIGRYIKTNDFTRKQIDLKSGDMV